MLYHTLLYISFLFTPYIWRSPTAHVYTVPVHTLTHIPRVEIKIGVLYCTTYCVGQSVSCIFDGILSRLDLGSTLSSSTFSSYKRVFFLNWFIALKDFSRCKIHNSYLWSDNNFSVVYTFQIKWMAGAPNSVLGKSSWQAINRCSESSPSLRLL